MTCLVTDSMRGTAVTPAPAGDSVNSNTQLFSVHAFVSLMSLRIIAIYATVAVRVQAMIVLRLYHKMTSVIRAMIIRRFTSCLAAGMYTAGTTVLMP